MNGEPTAEALVLTEPRSFEHRSTTRPAATDSTGVLRVEACGLCGTDHEQYTGHIRSGFAFVPGHEIVGTVEELGPAAAERWGVAAGDRVAVEVFHDALDHEDAHVVIDRGIDPDRERWDPELSAYLPGLFHAEVDLARGLARLLREGFLAEVGGHGEFPAAQVAERQVEHLFV